MIDLRRLQVLRVLHEHGTVTAAAQALYLTPSAVSQQIRQLSRDLGVDLLERVGRQVRLTSTAHTLLSHADRLYAQWELARADLAAVGEGEAGQLRLCGFPTGLASLLTPAGARLRQAHPRLAVHLTETQTIDCFDLLLADQADIAVVVAVPEGPPLDDPRFDQQPLLDDPLDLVVPVDHPLANRGSVELAETAHESWIVPSDSIDHYHVTLVACATAGFAPRMAHQAQEWPAVIALVAHGFGICLLPRLAPLPSHQAVVRIPLRGKPTPSRRILACVRRGSHRQPAIAKGLEALHEISRQLPPPLLSPDGPGQDHERGQRPHRHTRAADPAPSA